MRSILKDLGRWGTAVAVLLVLLVSLASRAAFAQVDMGSVSGVIRDPSNAAIPNATVTLTNEGTGIAVSTVTGPEGQYSFNLVKVGSYFVTASANGFQSVQRKNITVDVQQKVNFEIVLSIGQST